MEYDAEDIYFAVDTGIATLTGDAHVVSGDMTLNAHVIVLNLKPAKVCAYGNRTARGPGLVVRIQGCCAVFQQDELCYNFKTARA